MKWNNRMYLNGIEKWFFKSKILIIYGARQVGKTTILKILKQKYENLLILTSENLRVKETLESRDINQIKFLFGKSKIVAIDEAQKIENIGQVLKYIHDQELDIQLIVTGSSSFDLSNIVTEALTGRNIKFVIYPYSLSELIENNSGLWVINQLDQILIYGQYPEIFDAEHDDKEILLQNLTSDYLFQDKLQQERLRNSNDLLRILKALALQIGSEVSYHEVSQLLGLAPQTIERYIELLEKNFIIYTLHSYSKNLRNELKKSKKIYFNDLGIRNAIISNFAPLENRMDVGALWENFCINERLKYNSINKQTKGFYFWRTYDQAEVDLIEEYDGQLDLFKFKYNPKKSNGRFPNSILQAYPIRKKVVINRKNLFELIEE